MLRRKDLFRFKAILYWCRRILIFIVHFTIRSKVPYLSTKFSDAEAMLFTMVLKIENFYPEIKIFLFRSFGLPISRQG